MKNLTNKKYYEPEINGEKEINGREYKICFLYPQYNGDVTIVLVHGETGKNQRGVQILKNRDPKPLSWEWILRRLFADGSCKIIFDNKEVKIDKINIDDEEIEFTKDRILYLYNRHSLAKEMIELPNGVKLYE